jgi:hypothetical protein
MSVDVSQSNLPATLLRSQLGLISQEDLSVLLGVAKGTLREWRKLKKGPNFVRVEKAVFYRQKDVEAWLEGNTIVIEQKS